MSIKLMSFNILHCMNWVTKEIDFDVFANEIRRYNADIIGLNEVRGKGTSSDYQEQAKILAEKLGFYYYFAEATKFEGSNPYGNAILSRYPIISAQTIMIPDPEVKAFDGYYETRCLLKAKVDICGGLEVYITHFGLNPDEQENAVNTVIANIKEEKCILMGDFNITPEDPLLVPISARMYDTAVLLGENLLSFPADEPTVKIDYIFISPDLKALTADIPADIVSDHRPCIAVVEF